MADTATNQAQTDLRAVAEAASGHARTFLSTVTDVASGAAPDAAISLLILAISDVLAAGARLGAMVDVVPPDRFEPDAGDETDLEPLREALELQLGPLDEYVEIVDPVLGAEVGKASVSGDVAAVAEAIAKGLQHYDAGCTVEALWWWQFSYLSLWGERGASALRVLQMVLGHFRLDVDDDVAAEAEYDALQA
ncbi:uncharacterized protein DUF5063 [Sediminihabitans luteus]|uniref:Uncharacterized protein DUF5063 n=1 Tax=Sediminihabitans luteus TaxID=1138585 RepID=A0A2M9CEL2_9CELL|nr:DUF5063 domain-containing protein [Sediminihabitans luteus]PJJ70333.1 uncharacterized protein DUF5063 [Sediminihabitans luteus]GII97805.1 DUF5063 domain-containing protein [Sediminihabitans luteus]